MIMRDFPRGQATATLSFWFLEKLCERLEAQSILPTGEAARIWAAIVQDLEQNRGTALPDQSLFEINRLKLAQK